MAYATLAPGLYRPEMLLHRAKKKLQKKKKRPIGAARHVAGLWWVPGIAPFPQVQSICGDVPFSRLPTVIDKWFVGDTGNTG